MYELVFITITTNSNPNIPEVSSKVVLGSLHPVHCNFSLGCHFIFCHHVGSNRFDISNSFPINILLLVLLVLNMYIQLWCIWRHLANTNILEYVHTQAHTRTFTVTASDWQTGTDIFSHADRLGGGEAPSGQYMELID